jgi:membrane-associated protease RseP (regulator of RpoE activity)
VECGDWDDPDVDAAPLYPVAPIPFHERTWRHPSELAATTTLAEPPATTLTKGVIVVAAVLGAAFAFGLVQLLTPSSSSNGVTAGNASVQTRLTSATTVVASLRAALVTTTTMVAGTTLVAVVSSGTSVTGVPTSASSRGGWLGVKAHSTPNGGLEVEQIVPGSPAQSAGMQTGDVITDIDERPVTTPGELTEALRAHDPGAHVMLGLVRNGTPTSMPVLLGTATP